MLPFFRVEESFSVGVGAHIEYGYLDCGHKALSFKITALLWVLNFGFELK